MEHITTPRGPSVLEMDARDPSSYKPSAYYFRRALRRARTKNDMLEVGLQVVRELEHVKAWARSLGLIPPKRFILKSEMDEKNLAAIRRMRLRVVSVPAILSLLDQPDHPQKADDAQA